MHPRLDEIRKRLLTTPAPPSPPRYKAPARSSTVFSRSLEEGEHGERTLQGIGSPDSLQAHNPEDYERAAQGDARAAAVEPVSTDGLAQAVAELFEPARQCQSRLVEITKGAEAVTQLTRLAVELREPLQTFHDHIRKLSSSFESMRTFRDELGELAQSFAPVRALHRQVIQMAQTVRGQLADVARGLEPAKALQVEIADLTAAIDSVNELQARFYELSEAFGDGARAADTADTAQPNAGSLETVSEEAK